MMNPASLPHEKLMRATELIGSRVAGITQTQFKSIYSMFKIHISEIVPIIVLENIVLCKQMQKSIIKQTEG